MSLETPTTEIFVGQWERTRAERPLSDEGALMHFKSDGGLIYGMRSGGKMNFALLVWRLDGSDIVVDQPSAPREDRTAVALVSRNEFVLGNVGDRTWWRRLPSEAGA